MATLRVLRFRHADQAEKALASLEGLQQQHVVVIADAAIGTWPEDRKSPRTIQAHNTVSAGALSGSFWGMLFGFLFFMPLLGAVIGAVGGAVSGALTDIGINDDFISKVREKVTRGTSALFLLAQTDAPDRIAEELSQFDPELITTNLSREQEDRLRELFDRA